MKIETNITINGNVANKIDGRFDNIGLDAYEVSTDKSYDSVIYLVDKNGDVKGSININCEMGQGCGYVDTIKIKNL